MIGLEGGISTHRASVVLPYQHCAGAIAGLRAELRHQITQRSPAELARWDTFAVYGPVESTDVRGRTWFEYSGSVETRRLG